ncbi:MAG: HYR domain-containing protein, partial [Bacteroidales bacterium]|nr:HYR domain-containing protein [Bacteroidales bacterium]
DVTLDCDDVTGLANALAMEPTATDNCGTVTVTLQSDDTTPGVCAAEYTRTRTWTADDGCGNISTVFTQIITVEDNEAPIIITNASDLTVECDGAGNTSELDAWLNSNGGAIASDNCGTISWSNDFSGISNLCGETGSATVTFTASDDCGNHTSATATFTIVDNIPPSIVCPADLINIPTNQGLCTATINPGTASATDQCSGTNITISGIRSDGLALNEPYPEGLTTITWTAIDDCGNISNPCIQTIIVIDNENPTITCPADVSVNTDNGECFASNVDLGTPATDDNCTVADVSNDAPDTFPLGNTTVTWIVTDGSGNTAQCTQTVTVDDNENPTITCPADVAVNTDNGLCSASNVALGIPVTDDNCTVADVSNDAPATFPLGNTTVTWTVTDGAGNTAQCTQTVTVVDNENPTITCPADVAVNTDNGLCTASSVALGTPVTDDNCTVADVSNDAPATFPLGNTIVTWTVTDGAGNTAQCTQTVTVDDNENPTITCPADVAVNTDNGFCSASNVALGNPVTDDNCSVADVSNDAPTTFPLGSTIVTWTVTDGAGNTAQCTQTVTVDDNENPTITCPADVAVNTDNGLCSASNVALGTPVTDDNCSVADVSNDAPATFPLGNTTVTWTVTDGAGNTAQCTQTVTVNDNENPTIT